MGGGERSDKREKEKTDQPPRTMIRRDCSGLIEEGEKVTKRPRW